MVSKVKRASLERVRLSLFLSKAFSMGKEGVEGHAKRHNKAGHAV